LPVANETETSAAQAAPAAPAAPSLPDGPAFPKNKPGRRIRTMPALNNFTPYIMRMRCDATVYFRDSVEIGEAEQYLRAKRAEGLKGMGMLQLFIAAYVRTMSQMPALNRYVCGQRIYARKDIQVLLIVKESMTAAGEEGEVRVTFSPTDTIYDVYDKLKAGVESVRSGGAEGNDTVKVANVLNHLPRFLLRFFMAVIKFQDYHQIMPKWMMDLSPFHGSMAVTDLGSLGISPACHHLYNFGTVPIFCALGMKRRAWELGPDGKVVEKRYIDYTVDVDERICDGFAYAQALKMWKNLMRHPAALDNPPEKVIPDIP